MELQEACLRVIKPGAQLKQVYAAAVEFLKSSSKTAYLVGHLPKNLGFCTGLDFRENALLLSPKNSVAFKRGMVFCLSIGFQDLDLPEDERSSVPDNSAVRILYTTLAGLLTHHFSWFLSIADQETIEVRSCYN